MAVKPLLHLLSLDTALHERLRHTTLFRLQVLRHADELALLHANALLMIDTAHPALPAWSAPTWSHWGNAFKLIVASSEPNDEEGLKALDIGAQAYCHAYANAATLQQVIEVVSNGGLWLGRQLMHRLLHQVQEKVPVNTAPNWHKNLTEREIEVARLAAHGHANAAIAAQLGVTERTIKAHLSAVFEKLEVSDRLQLALKVHGIQTSR